MASESSVSVSSDPAFIKYPSTESFPHFVRDFRRIPDRTIVGGRFLGTVKLHGSNISVVFRPGCAPQIQSRNRILSEEQDSYKAYGLLSKVPFGPLIRDILAVSGQDTYEEVILVTELCGTSIQKGVALVHLPNFFALFNICIDGSWVPDMRSYSHISVPLHRIFNVVDIGPVWEVEIKDLYDDECVKEAEAYMMEQTVNVGNECPFSLNISPKLLTNGKEARGPGEGIVWTWIQDRPSPDLLNFKTKSEKFSTTAHAPKPPKTPSISSANSEAFVEYACPYGGRRMEQGIEYLVEMHNASNGITPSMTPHFIKWVVDDTLKEERGEFERFGVPTTTAGEAEVKKLIMGSARKWFVDQCGKAVR